MTNNRVNLGYLSRISVLLLVFVVGFAFSVAPVVSISTMEHDATATITPNQSSCENLGNFFTVNVENDEGYGIYNVKIYKAQTNIVNISCGEAPAGWISNGLKYNSYCDYETDPYGNETIESGENLNFTFNANLTQINCTSTFIISTLDNEGVGSGCPGQEKSYNLTLEVDCTPPIIEKELESGFGIGVCPPDQQSLGDVCWIQHDTIKVHAYDNLSCDQDNCNLGLDYCVWNYTVDGVLNDTGIEYPDPGYDDLYFNITFDEDSVHNLTIVCYDVVGNRMEDIEVFRVDDTPPETNKTYGNPHYPTGINDANKTNYPHWITTHTPVTLTAVDPDPTGHGCNIDNLTTYYRNIWLNPDGGYGIENSYVDYCADYATCMSWPQNDKDGSVDWELYNGTPFYKEEESCHIIEYYSVDELGNREDTKWQCVYVEDTPPVREKVVGEPRLNCNIFFEDFEDGAGGWTHGELTPRGECENLDNWELRNTAYGTDNYNFDSMVYGTTNNGNHAGYEHSYLMSPVIELPVGENVELRFNSYTANEGGCPDWYDVEWIEISNDGGENWTTLNTCGCDEDDDYNGDSITSASNRVVAGNIGSMDNNYDWCGNDTLHYNNDFRWRTYTYNLNDYEGQNVSIRFRYDTGDSCCGPTNQEGWYIDNVIVRNECDWWVRDHVTEVNLSCVDPDPHPVGQEEVCFRIGYDVQPWLTSNYCTLLGGNLEGGNDSYCCIDNGVTIVFQEDSNHTLEYYCRDALGNEDEVDLEYFRVDSVPPTINKTIVGPQVGDCPPRPGTDDKCYIKDWTCINEFGVTDNSSGGGSGGGGSGTCTQGTTIIIDAYDNESLGCAVDDVQCEWGYTLDNVEFFGWNPCEGPHCEIRFYEDTKHDLAVRCWDYLGNEAWDNETFYLDSQPPVTVKSYGEPQKVEPNCLAMCESNCIVPTQIPGANPNCVEACVHEFCTIWINSNTPVTLNATDLPNELCAVGVNKTYWRNTLVDNSYCWDVSICDEAIGNESVPFTEYTGAFYKPDYSCHLIEYYSEDYLGNVEEIKKQCVFVDNLAPKGNKTVGEPKIRCNGSEFNTTGDPTGPECWWVRDHVTSITLDCEDQNPHPVNGEEVCYKVSYDYVYNNTSQTYDWGYITGDYCAEFGGKMEGDLCCAPVADEPYVFNFTEDSVHNLEYYCRDSLGNEDEVDLEYFKVDSVAPNTTKTYLGAYYVDENGAKYIDTASWIELTAEDGGEICAVGVEGIYWQTVRYESDYYCQNSSNCDTWTPDYLQNMSGVWNTYTQPFGIPNESCHIIAYYANDSLGNTEDIQYQCVFVDKTPPIIEKWYEGPEFYECDTNGYPKWINSETNVTMNVYDSDPHPSGVKEASYRISLVDDENCWNQTLCEESAMGNGTWTDFESVYRTQIGEQSCHLIEINATDNVDKKSTHKQCVFVDNAAPTPNKTVSEPRELWTPRNLNDSEYDGDTSYFYPEANELCWVLPEDECKNASSDECLECWKVTRDTPITMDCVDPEPHPVNHEKVCFIVEEDGNDRTEEYCEEYGVYNESGNGFCCAYSIIEDFRFRERSEHELEYYCEDALGNKGELDIEKFKVIGDSFGIQLNKKWNLISVPFVLLDNNITKVFEDINDEIDSVWTFDKATDKWSVYRPGEEGTSDLDEMNPGWGYWVMADNDTELIIGGDMYNPVTTPPSRQLKEGWNLIGYYGIDDEGCSYYNGPDGEGRVSYCALYTLRNEESIYPPTKWSSLLTYWENDYDEFTELGVCERLDSGAGYWLYADEDKGYTRATTCPEWLVGLICSP